MSSLLRVLCCFLMVFQTNTAPPTPQQAASATQQTPSAGCKPPCLEDGTPVKLRFSQTVSSADAHVDDRVEFEVLEEIKIAEVIVVPKGGIAWGTVTEAQPKRRMARGGKLEIVMDSVRLVDGEKAALRATKEVKGGGHTGAMTAGIVVTGLLVWPAAPFFLFMHGKDISIPKGTEVPTFVNGNFHLELSKFQQGAPTTNAQTPPAQQQPNASAQAPATTDVQVTLNSTPGGAEVEIDGAFVGNTPSTIGLAPGDHTIGVKKNGYKAWEKRIKVSSGKVTISAELESEVKAMSAEVAPTTTPEPEESKQKTGAASEHPVAPPSPAQKAVNAGTPENSGTVSLASDPSGAEVYVDDSMVGKAPVTLNLKPGQHYVRMFAKDYKNWSQQIMVVPGSELTLTAKLQKSD